ncbi:MAG: helix-turn-helix domain-containing protein, partial [candidate division WOR-3 bacterium]
NNKFRKDLYYRLNVVSIHLPPLRERIEDLPVLVRYFIKKYSEKYDKKIRSIDDDLIRELCSYEWPGNVRELEHYIERGVINDIDGIITGEDLEFHPQIRVKDISLKKTKKRLELEMLTSVLIRNRGNVTRSAQELEISRKTLYNLLKRYRINIKDLIKFD